MQANSKINQKQPHHLLKYQAKIKIINQARRTEADKRIKINHQPVSSSKGTETAYSKKKFKFKVANLKTLNNSDIGTIQNLHKNIQKQIKIRKRPNICSNWKKIETNNEIFFIMTIIF